MEKLKGTVALTCDGNALCSCKRNDWSVYRSPLPDGLRRTGEAENDRRTDD